MSTDTQLVVQEGQHVARTAPTVADMLQAVIQKGVSGENIAALEKLVGLYERMEDRNSEKAFAAAFVALQAEMPSIQALKAVPGRDGTAKYKYAPYEDIWKQLKPHLERNGFSVRFSQKIPDEKRITMACTLMHIGGHSVTNEFTVRVGSGPPNASEAQSDGSASSYAQRGALCDCLNINIRHDDDARSEGGPVTKDQAFELERRVAETNSNQEAFLRLAGSKDFASIPSAKYDILDELLSRKEGKKK